MEAIEQLLGSGASISPSGHLLACLADDRLKIAYVQAPERAVDFKIRLPSKNIASIKWSDNSARLLVFSGQFIEVIGLEDESHRVRLDNGSGGLGRFTSADFVGNDHLLTIWEFGRAKVWDLLTGKGVELGDLKTKSDGRNWAVRPSENPSLQALALLSRAHAQDQLTLHFPSNERTLEPALIGTTDARNVSWSPDGRWIAILDTPHAHPSLVILTSDGQPYRTYTASTQNNDDALDLGIKMVAWSADSRLLAIARHDSTITLLNTKTFAPLAVIEHSATIDQRNIEPADHAIIWQETVSASSSRSYVLSAQPVSPALSRAKASNEPSEAGVAELRFSADGRYLATRDENMLSTVWIWDTHTLHAHAVLIQHNNVRRMQWHSTKRDLLLIDCGESIAYLFDASSDQPPVPIEATMPVTPLLSFAPSKSEDSKPVILAATRTAFTLIFPEGREEVEAGAGAARFDDTVMEDSLIDVLTGKTPVPRKTEPSYTEQVDLDAEMDDGQTMRMDDTFREKKKAADSTPARDPFDDSEIF